MFNTAVSVAAGLTCVDLSGNRLGAPSAAFIRSDAQELDRKDIKFGMIARTEAGRIGLVRKVFSSDIRLEYLDTGEVTS